jgi:SAM-dependent methyltransferase
MTLEHVHDPGASLRRMWDWLRPEGRLALSVPDCGGWQFDSFRSNWFALQVPSHLYHFTPESLHALLTKNGFTSIEVRWQRTLFDVPMSLALWAEERYGQKVGGWARRAAGSLLCRGACRVFGAIGAPFRWTGRLTVWAQKPA